MFSRSLLRFLVLPILSVLADYPPFANNSDYSNGTYGYYPTQAFITEPDFLAPVANLITPPKDGVAPFKHFLWAPGGPLKFVPVTGPMVIEADTLSIVWQGPVYDSETIGMAVQECNSEQYLTWWSGFGWANGKGGRAFITNNKYELKHNISAMDHLRYADAHEVFLTPQCTVVMTAYEPQPYNLTAFNITDGWILESHFQEVDLATGKLLFSWSASDFVDIMDSVWSPELKKSGHKEYHAYDWFHINSVQKDGRGNYLVSSRHTNSVYYISGISGKVIWTLGGLKNDFEDLSDGRATDFSWQHHARWVDANMTQLSLFDDRNSAYIHSDRPLSRGVVIELDYTRHTAKLLNEWDARHGITSQREGSMQLLPNGNAILGYGEEPALTEFSPSGEVLWDVIFGPIGQNRRTADNYRIMKTNWTGAPTQPPKIAAGPPPKYDFNKTSSLFKIREVDDQGNSIPRDTVYISWNGATEAKKWVLLASNMTQELTVARDFWTVIDKAGFETSLLIGGAARYLQALAIDDQEHVLSASMVLDMTDGHLETRTMNLDAIDSELATQLHGTLDHLREKWDQVTSQVQEAGKPHLLGLLGLLIGAVLAAVVTWALIRCHRQRRGYQRANSDEGDADHYGRDVGKYRDIDPRALSSSHSQASSCLSDDLKKHEGIRPLSSGG